MNNHQVFFIISSLTILLKTNSYAWVIPMEKLNSDLEEEWDVDAIDSSERFEYGSPEDPEAEFGIKIVKLTRQDPIMQIFDFNMDLARQFAYKEWQTLLAVYVPVIDEYTIELTEQESEENDTQAAPNESKSQENGAASPDPRASLVRPNLKAEQEYDEDAPQRVAQALEDVRSKNEIHSGLK